MKRRKVKKEMEINVKKEQELTTSWQ